MIKEIGPMVLELVRRPGGLDLVVYHETGTPEPWIGVASFPAEMEDEAMFYMDSVVSENDVEDLLRQWAPAETWDSFQILRNKVGV